MPFQSQAQRGYMYSHHPKIAEEFEKKTPEGKLPYHKHASHLAHDTGGTYERQDYYLVPVRKISGDTYYEIRVNNMWVQAPHFPTTDEGAASAIKYAEQYIRAHPKPKGKKMNSEIGPQEFHKEMENRMKKLSSREEKVKSSNYQGAKIDIYKEKNVFGKGYSYRYEVKRSDGHGNSVAGFNDASQAEHEAMANILADTVY